MNAQRRKHRPILDWLLCVFVIMGCIVAQISLAPTHTIFYQLFLFGVVLCSLFCQHVQSVVAFIVFAATLQFYFLEPRWSFPLYTVDAVGWSFFLIVGSLMLVLARRQIVAKGLWQRLCNIIPQIVWTAHEDGTPEYTNIRWDEYTGAPYRGSWLESLHPDDRNRVNTAWMDAVRSGQKYFEIEYRLRSKEGQYRWFLVRGNLVAFNSLEKWVGTLTDIHDRKTRREKELAQWRSDAVKKDEFLAMLAHELRNPLAVIMNSIQVLQHSAIQCPETDSDCGGIEQCSTPGVCFAKQGDFCSDIRAMIFRQTKHLGRLVDDLMDVSRITRGKVNLRRQVIDLNEAIKAGVEMIRPFLVEKKHKLRLELSESIKVYADNTRLVQVVSNILNNAVKYTPSGGEIVVKSYVVDNGAFMSVKDNGVGLAPDQINSIFDLFVQVEVGLDRSQGGLGIGLTLVRSIMTMHDGDVKAHSEGLGKGSEFVITLPVVLGDASLAVIDKISKSVTRSILVVDDIQDAADSMAALLKFQGHEVRTAHTGHEALRMIEEKQPEFVLLDIGLPEMDGYAIARELKHKYGNDIILVAVTGYGMADDKRKSLDAGFNYHLIKPIEPKDWVEILK